jgi:lysophospholipase L1-like esterase
MSVFLQMNKRTFCWLGILAAIVAVVPVQAAPAKTNGAIAPETIGQKLRRLQHEAAKSNPLLAFPLINPEAWKPATTYQQGEIVAAGKNLYLCHLPGTSAEAGKGPEGAGAVPISDGAVTWYYYGPAPHVTSTAAPALSTSLAIPAGLTNTYTIPAHAASFAFSGGAPHLKYPNQYCFAAITDSPSGGQCSSTHSNNWASITFLTDAPKVAIGQYTSLPSRIIVDGRYLTLSGLRASVAVNPSYYVLDFSAVGGRKTRQITLESEFNSMFWGVRVDPESKVWAPDAAGHVRVIAIGDSITGGGDGFPDLPGEDWPSLVAKMLGWNDVWNSAIGGTGFIATARDAFPNFGQRIQDVCQNNPDLVIVFGGINDGVIASPAQIQAAARAYFQAIRACLPSTPMIVLGAWPASTGPAPARIDVETALHTAVTQFHDRLTYFVPIATDPTGSWIAGTGNVGSPNGTGNADKYIDPKRTHPTDAGIRYLAERIAAAVGEVIKQIP